MKMETLKQQILTAKGDVRAELVLKNARVINVFTNEIEQADVAIRQGVILGVGHYTGETELDLQGKYVCPGRCSPSPAVTRTPCRPVLR